MIMGNKISDQVNDPAGEYKKRSILSAHEREQLRTWLNTTPAQRLAWLEEALTLAAGVRDKPVS